MPCLAVAAVMVGQEAVHLTCVAEVRWQIGSLLPVAVAEQVTLQEPGVPEAEPSGVTVLHRGSPVRKA
jgi:hypothetical protein